MKPIDQYTDNMKEYEIISHKLNYVKHEFQNTTREKQRRMLLDSYIFAAISPQTPVRIQEEAFTRFKKGENLKKALASVNYRKNKASYIRETQTRFEIIDHIINLLEKGEVDAAHKNISKNMKGVSTVKASFTLAMLGYQQKACLDTNVLQAAETELKDLYTGVNIQKFDRQTETLLQKAGPELPNHLTNFMKQWIIFDAERGELTNHKTFFENIGGETQ